MGTALQLTDGNILVRVVRITNDCTKHVRFARTYDFSTMAVATGNEEVSAHFEVLAGTETGPSHLEVIANGIPAESYQVYVYDAQTDKCSAGATPQ